MRRKRVSQRGAILEVSTGRGRSVSIGQGALRLILGLLLAGSLALVMSVQAAAAATLVVDDPPQINCPGAPYTAIQPAIIAASPGDTIQVCPGAYPGNLVLNKDLTLNGAQATVDARGRTTPNESTITAAGTLLTLITGSAGSTIDGFTFLGGSRAIESATGPINDLQILNNRILGFTGNGLFLNDNGINITVDQNDVDGTAKVGPGDLIHLDTDNFDGFWLTNNRIVNGATASGFFVDGNRNVDHGPGARVPRFIGNFINRNLTGTNLGSRAWGDGPIRDNTFSNNSSDGLQGGPRNALISENTFDRNGRNGLALTSFGNATDPTRGAQNNNILSNCFTGNGLTMAGAGILFSATQFPGTISTNVAHQNNIRGNAMGARYPLPGTELINAENNWWGAANGPGPPDGTGSGDGVDGHMRIDFTPWRMTPAGGTPCSAGPPATLTLTGDAVNPVDTEHCVTATVRDASGAPVPDVTVEFTVTGSVNTSGSETTDANGEAVFCYMGPALPGSDVITAFADTNNSGTPDPGEPFDVITKTWVPPTTTPGCEIMITNGGWIIADNGDRGIFGGNAKADEDGDTTGNEVYEDKGPAEPFKLHGDVLTVVCDPDSTRATIFGEATIDGTGSHPYRIDVQDLGEPGKGRDRYRMRVDAYDSGEHTLQAGNVNIRRSS
jgi:Big-like domain-containing protein